MCVCVLSLSVSVLLLLSLDVALSQTFTVSLSPSPRPTPPFKGSQHISILCPLYIYLLGLFCGISERPPQHLFLWVVAVAYFVFCWRYSLPGEPQGPFALRFLTVPPGQVFALFL